jgi:DNA-binding transcriptional MerR regulator
LSDGFIFTVTDLALFLGKSAVTLRGWERKGLISLPRDSGGDRKLTTTDVRAVARTARELGRISEYRLRLIETAITMMQIIEGENI